MNVIKLKRENNTLDIALMVEKKKKTERQEYDESAIVDALIREANCDKALAKEVAGIVTERLMNANLDVVSTSLIRSMVNNVLLEKGLNKELKNNSEASIPFYNITEIIENANKENGNTAHNPESINLTLAERILKEYALKNVLSEFPNLKYFPIVVFSGSATLKEIESSVPVIYDNTLNSTIKNLSYEKCISANEVIRIKSILLKHMDVK